MSNLSGIERKKMEAIFAMKDGYVLNFTNSTFEDFVFDSINLVVNDGKYDKYGNSKAKRLRAIWDIESNHSVGILLNDLLEYRRSEVLIGSRGILEVSEGLLQEGLKIVERLKNDSPVENLEALSPNNADQDFALLSRQIKESIEKHEPETALDRLHTFCIKFFREMNERYKLTYTKETPLHNLVGAYIKRLKEAGWIESQMTERILKSSISVFDSFNQVRNNQSLAHDNQILNFHESILIFNNVANTIKFIKSIEDSISENKTINSDSSYLDFGDLML